MAHRSVLLDLAPRDLTLEGGDPRIELGDRQGIEILPHQCVKQIVGTGGCIIRIHRTCNVDPHPSDVNKAL